MRVALAIVGVVAILCGLFGLFYNYSSFSALIVQGKHEFDPEIPYFNAVFFTMSAICVLCYIVLIVCGVQLARKRLAWVWVFIGVQMFEVIYFFSIALLWLVGIAAPRFGSSVAAATGVANGGLMAQFLILLPLWGTIVAILAKRKLESAASTTTV